MLDCDDTTELIAEQIATLPCELQLPPELRAKLDQQGHAPSMIDDRRRFVRFRCGSKRLRAAMRFYQTFPALPREANWHGIFVSEISRAGLRLLHSEPVYPGESLRVVMSVEDETLDLRVEAVRCQRLGTRCFEVGVRKVAHGGQHTAEPAAGST